MTDTVTPGADTTTVVDTQTTPATQTTPVVTTSTTVVDPATTTVATTPVTETTPKAWFADDWREKMANGDTKELDRLRRFSDPMAIYNSYRGLEGKVSSGQVKMGLPDNATTEQLTQYRKDNGIPEAPTDYKLQFAQGFVPAEGDAPIIEHMLGILHEGNVTNEMANKVINGYYEIREAEAAQKVETQKAIRAASEDQLRQQWGGNFRPNLMAVQNLLASAPKGVMDMIDQAVLPDGSKLGNSALALSWLAALARDVNPAGTVVPGATGNQLEAINKELDELKAFMSKDINGWRKDTAKQARFRELVNADLKLQARK